MRRKKQTYQLPEWLWFFLILPLSLIVALLWKRRQLAAQMTALMQRVSGEKRQQPRYTEPDSIPIDTREPIEIEPEPIGTDAEDVALFAADASTGTLEASETDGGDEGSAESSDDLKVIEGIGPSISGLLVANGIRTYRQLADAPVERLEQILTEANLRRLSNPATWPEQAALAARGQWDDLKTLQGTLKGGRRQQED